ncbi:MAG: TonB-dependent receptor [Pseudomonadota bacterium]
MHHQHLPLRKTLLATLIAVSCHGAAFAEDNPPTISVTASPIETGGSPGSATLDKTQLQTRRTATSDSASLLKGLPGVSVQSGGGVSGLPVIRGLADDRLRIKVDGMDLISACGNHMNPPLSYIDPSNVGNATVFAGLSPVSSGGDSIGGTILVDSSAPRFAAPGEESLFAGEAGFFVRDNGNAHGDSIRATAASETVSLTFASATTEAENYHAGGDFKSQDYVNDVGDSAIAGDEVGSSMYKSTNRSLSLAHRSENQLTELKLGMQDIPYQGWTNQRMDMTGNDSTQINLRHKAELDWGDLEARAYRERTRHKMQFFDDKLYWYGANDGSLPDGESCTLEGGMNGCAAGMPMDTLGDNRGAVVKADIFLTARDLLRAGVEMQNYTLDDWWEPSGKGMWPDTFWNINNGQRDRLALFTEWEAQWNDQLLTQFGIRGERVTMDADAVQGYSGMFSADDAADFNAAERDKSDDNLDLTALARLSPSATQTIEFGLAQKSRSPNLYERYAWSTHGMAMRMVNMAGDGNGYVGNLELEPEVAHTLSATFAWHDEAKEQWGLEVSPYYTRVKDYIDAERCSSASTSQTAGTACTDANLDVAENFVYLQFVNQEATLYGIDIAGHYPLAQSSGYGDLTLQGQLSYVAGENDTTGDNLYNMMPLNMTLALAQRKGGWRNVAEVEWVDDKDDVSATRNEMTTDSYSLLHLRSSYTWQQVRFDVGVENVFDKLYSHPQGGAYLGEGKTMSGTAVDWGTTAPGMGRSLYAGVNIKF